MLEFNSLNEDNMGLLDEEKLFQNDERKYLFVSFFTSSYKTPDDEDGDSEEKGRGVEMNETNHGWINTRSLNSLTVAVTYSSF